MRALEKKNFFLEKHFTLNKKGRGLDDKIAMNAKELGVLIERMHQIYAMCAGYPYAPRDNSLSKRETIAIISECLSTLYGKECFSRKQVAQCFGTGKKKLSPYEKKIYRTTNRSLLAVDAIEKGERLNWQNSRYLRAEKNQKAGLNYKHLAYFTRYKARRKILAGEPIGRGDVVVC